MYTKQNSLAILEELNLVNYRKLNQLHRPISKRLQPDDFIYLDIDDIMCVFNESLSHHEKKFKIITNQLRPV